MSVKVEWRVVVTRSFIPRFQGAVTRRFSHHRNHGLETASEKVVPIATIQVIQNIR